MDFLFNHKKEDLTDLTFYIYNEVPQGKVKAFLIYLKWKSKWGEPRTGIVGDGEGIEHKKNHVKLLLRWHEWNVLINRGFARPDITCPNGCCGNSLSTQGGGVIWTLFFAGPLTGSFDSTARVATRRLQRPRFPPASTLRRTKSGFAFGAFRTFVGSKSSVRT